MAPSFISPFAAPLRPSAAALTCSSTNAFIARKPLSLQPQRRRAMVCRPSMATTEPPKKQTRKELARLYGGSYLGTSIGLSIISYALMYGLVYVGVDVRGITNAFGNWLATTPFGRPEALDNISDAASAAAIAYVAHKVTSPLRFPLTIAATPFVARLVSGKSVSDDSKSS